MSGSVSKHEIYLYDRWLILLLSLISCIDLNQKTNLYTEDMMRLVSLLVKLMGWTFAGWAFILPVTNREEISANDMAKQDSAQDVTVPR